MKCAPARATRHFPQRGGFKLVFHVFAPAKINLCLHVTGQRPDGYHLLDTLVSFATVGDVLTVRCGAGGVHVTGPERGNLHGPNIISAVLARFDAQNLEVRLHKNLPVASGIGGGSSDAAAAYRGLGAVLGRSAKRGDMDALLAIGADVPMCVQAQAALVRGIGEDITPVPKLALLHAVLVNPRVPVPTPQIFARLTQKENPGLAPLPSALDRADVLMPWLLDQRNDLQSAAIALAPQIADVLAALAHTGAAVMRMSGSGATCFGLYPTAFAAKEAAFALSKAQPNWWVAPCDLNGDVDVSPRQAQA